MPTDERPSGRERDDAVRAMLRAVRMQGARGPRRGVTRTLIVEMPGCRLRIGHEAHDPALVTPLPRAGRA